MTTDASAPARRTRLTPEREQELYEAVIELLGEVGYEALTMDAVAARTRSSKATLYRQWKSKPELVVTALRCTKPAHAPVDTGSLDGDLHAMADGFGDGSEVDTSLMRGLAHASATSPDLAEAMREHLIDPALDGMRQLLTRAADRGEIPGDSPAAAFMPHMILGAVITRRMLEDVEVDAGFMHRYIDAVVLPALGFRR
ncbi:TetR/AcrR family transcriptional regulator [Streptomyces sp. NPDC046977]|uniref:TetR/AcrR family transcriptional regulator n=1 Tax=Streptomyces sp. NPDC046977 TaxID=3154703 RepID=UPI0033CC69D2